ncbi:OmpA family protein [Aggregicoccus sp. 17bor-14]|uniref:OmpA family protein n=1 Tax=Myxococcaceae TaxID=31 RepID=UPI00129C31B6|nr:MULTISPECIES: OmpA family protein [Myxococcaceae]MBF5044809.1 OmpA family protein [Simulacricoccus sp. 17bor-14]MRI90553.1 OmpA family protein [Aggregicoccus sp. 17bor-14]
MQGWKRWTWGVLGAAALAGCAGGMPRELLDARYAFQRASTGPAAQYSPAYLAQAREALDAANRSYEKSKDSEQTRTLSYVALRKAQIAEARAQLALAEQQRAQADQQLQAARSSDQARLRAELEQARSQLNEAHAMREEAERRQAEVAAQQEQAARDQQLAQAQQEEQQRAQRLADAEARMNQLNAQLDAERQARAQAEQRAAQAESAAAAQLRAIKQVKVKEDERGLVLTLSGSVLFRSGSSELLPAAKRRLNEVADALQKATNPLLIEGHTDSQGPDSLNEELSDRRAEVVRDYLIDQGVPGDRIRARGFGESRPVASNGTAEGRANNRRVEIVLERTVATGGSGAGAQPPAPGTGSTAQPPAPPPPGSSGEATPPPGTGGSGQVGQPLPEPGTGGSGDLNATDAGTGGSGDVTPPPQQPLGPERQEQATPRPPDEPAPPQSEPPPPPRP